MTSLDPDPVQGFGYGAQLKRIDKHKVTTFGVRERVL